jgi:hypothetical protein
LKKVFGENSSISENNISTVEATDVPLDMNFLPRYLNYFYQVIVEIFVLHAHIFGTMRYVK